LRNFFINVSIFLFLVTTLNLKLRAETINVVAEEFPRATNADGTGVQFEMVKAIFAPLGYQLNFKVFPYKRAIQQVEAGKADIIVGIYKFKTDKLTFSALPHDADRMVAIRPINHQEAWHGLSSLTNKRITATPGFKPSIEKTLVKIPYHFDEVSTREQALKKLMFNREDYMIDTEAVYLIDEINTYKAQLEKFNIGFFEIYAAFANTAKAHTLQKLWQSRFPTIIRSNKAKEIYSHWQLTREYNIINEYLNEIQHINTDETLVEIR
jgi:polar amino acid transport system substrate-binding protein